MAILAPKTHEYFMKAALEQAKIALSKEEIPIGAVVTINDKIIARGYNQVQMLNDSSAHAEMIALTAAYSEMGAKYLPNATLYVTIEPCLMCAGATFWSQIGTIVYGAREMKHGFGKHFHQELHHHHPVHPFHPKAQIIGGILELECSTLMQTFFKQKRS